MTRSVFKIPELTHDKWPLWQGLVKAQLSNHDQLDAVINPAATPEDQRHILERKSFYTNLELTGRHLYRTRRQWRPGISICQPVQHRDPEFLC